MKKVLSLLLVFIMLFAVSAVVVGAEVSPTKAGEYYITTDVYPDTADGKAEADKYEVEIGTDGTVKLTASGDGFEGWVIDGDYEIVSGDLGSKVLVIRPRSDIHAVAVFEDGGSSTSSATSGTNSGSTSPKTGNVPYALILMLLAVSAGVVAVVVSKKVKQ